MNDEDAFHAALDAHPDDHVTRLVFADWLQDRDDPRAEGYRALGTRGIKPSFGPVNGGDRWWIGDAACPALVDMRRRPSWAHYGSLVGRQWFEAIEGGTRALGCWMWFHTRREAEDAAALAFAKLPAISPADTTPDSKRPRGRGFA